MQLPKLLQVFFVNLGAMDAITELVYLFLLVFRLVAVLDKFVLFDPTQFVD